MSSSSVRSPPIAASHPHMFGAQVEWTHQLGGVPCFVAEADRDGWGADPDPNLVGPGRTARVDPRPDRGALPGQRGDALGRGGRRGVLLSGDTVFANPDRRSVAFMRSYPNHLPLSAGVTNRRALEGFDFDRLYGNFATRIDADARAVVRRSADRHIGWVRGELDHLT